MSFENVTYAELGNRFVELSKALQDDNPLGLTAEQGENMYKAFAISYLNLEGDLTPLQEINAPQLMDIATRLSIEFNLNT